MRLHEYFAFFGAEFVENTAGEGGCHGGGSAGGADEGTNFGDIQLLLFKQLSGGIDGEGENVFIFCDPVAVFNAGAFANGVGVPLFVSL